MKDVPEESLTTGSSLDGGSAYSSLAMRRALDDFLRPGGLASTREALSRIPLPPDVLVLDIGCGPGRSAAFLREEIPCRVVGMDLDETFLQEGRDAHLGPDFVRGDACSLPFGPSRLDAIFCECVLSLLSGPERALGEFERVMKPGGLLYMSDVFGRSESASPACSPEVTCLADPADLENWRQRLATCGLRIISEQDQTWLLRQTAGRIIFEYGSLELFWRTVLGPAVGQGCAGRIRELKPGYVFFVAVKDTPS